MQCRRRLTQRDTDAAGRQSAPCRPCSYPSSMRGPSSASPPPSSPSPPQACAPRERRMSAGCVCVPVPGGVNGQRVKCAAHASSSASHFSSITGASVVSTASCGEAQASAARRVNATAHTRQVRRGHPSRAAARTVMSLSRSELPPPELLPEPPGAELGSCFCFLADGGSMVADASAGRSGRLSFARPAEEARTRKRTWIRH